MARGRAKDKDKDNKSFSNDGNIMLCTWMHRRHIHLENGKKGESGDKVNRDLTVNRRKRK